MAKAKDTNNEDEIKTTADVPAEVEDAIIDAEAAEVAEEKAEVSTKKAPAKAGKRSAKALEEAEAELAKAERKTSQASDEEADKKPRQAFKPTRTKLERAGKNFRKVAEQVEAEKLYSLDEALELAVKTSPVKFDATVELHINLNVDPRHADQNLRDNFVLPQGTGKSVRVAVFADVDDAAKAKTAGADIAGLDELTKQLDKGVMDFNILIATPSQMAKLGKYARALGPKGLMPNPKSGTVTTDVIKAVAEAKAGRVEYRVDSTGIVHLGVGKVSFGKDRITENVQAVLTSIKSNKPASVKSNYVKAIHVTTTMGPSIKIETSALS